MNHGRRQECEVRGNVGARARAQGGQGKSLWVDKMSTRGHFTKTNISSGATGKGKGTVGQLPLPRLAPPMIRTKTEVDDEKEFKLENPRLMS